MQAIKSSNTFNVWLESRVVTLTINVIRYSLLFLLILVRIKFLIIIVGIKKRKTKAKLARDIDCKHPVGSIAGYFPPFEVYTV